MQNMKEDNLIFILITLLKLWRNIGFKLTLFFSVFPPRFSSATYILGGSFCSKSLQHISTFFHFEFGSKTKDSQELSAYDDVFR